MVRDNRKSAPIRVVCDHFSDNTETCGTLVRVRVRIVILAGGVGGSKFVLGVRCAYPTADLTVIANTADDITLHGLRICPDLDTIMYTLGGGGDPVRGWGPRG